MCWKLYVNESCTDRQIATAILVELIPRSVTKKTANACAKSVTTELVAISANLAIMVIRNAGRATAASLEARLVCAVLMESALACPTSPADPATSAALATTNIQNASVRNCRE